MRKTIPAIGLMLLLIGCEGGLSEQQTGEAHDVATDAAHEALANSAALAQHEARIAQLEGRIAELEFRVAHPEASR